jgi:hypothetical protein
MHWNRYVNCSRMLQKVPKLKMPSLFFLSLSLSLSLFLSLSLSVTHTHTYTHIHTHKIHWKKIFIILCFSLMTIVHQNTFIMVTNFHSFLLSIFQFLSCCYNTFYIWLLTPDFLNKNITNLSYCPYFVKLAIFPPKQEA